MRTYRLSLSERRRVAARRKERYWSEPEFRLSCINSTRAKAGLPPLESVPEGRIAGHDENGRFRRA